MSATQRMGSILLVVFAVIVGGAWQAAEKPVPVQKWEYKTLITPKNEEFQAVGEEGWELVAAHAIDRSQYLYFKRPKQ